MAGSPPRPEAAADLRAPSLRGPNVYLRPVTPDDYRSLHAAELSEELGPRWRFRGATPSPEQWSQATWDSTLAQFLVVDRGADRPIGIAAVHQANFRDGFAYLSAARFEPSRPSPVMMLGIALFLDYVFYCWDFRKLYMEVPEYNYEQLSSIVDRFAQLEGRLQDHLYLGGRYWDQMILAIHREQWNEASEQVLRVAGRG
jgi:RimJ/RimL family protein N-acetyltransferase